MERTVVLGAARTPFGKFGGALSPLSAPELGGAPFFVMELLDGQTLAERIYEQLQSQPDDLQKYVLLSALLNRNMHLFYRVLADHLGD